ncbi:MAG: isoaspartyl peptidase/L-asparaginase, partial [Bacteroidota bacterium]|nr:isoaspartyl peptidase/L-asparaginase [Bacteroidota bacterium]MDX5447089.1 isoaspartyl peptidase/L-asparaginase [Bacteroidota bacterium]MDX5504612.1 isoaspartyl peptidase/L-asparaginase [Bacteroidota bacterium]
TYADNRQCAVSATGWGEHFIRNVAAYQVFARMEYGGQGLSESVANTLLEVQETGGDGGLIAVDRQGNWVAKFNTDGMFRAARTPDTLYLGIFAE